MRVETTEDRGIRILSCEGRMMRDGSDEHLIGACDAALEDGGRVVIDLRKTVWMDSSGVGALVACAKHAAERGAVIKVALPEDGPVRKVFALCHLLGFYFMPRIRDLKDQQLYRIDRFVDYGVFTPLLTKTADLSIVEEQWDEMLRVALSLKQRIAPAHVIVQRLTNSFPADRLAKALTNLGRIIKTQYILRYLTDRDLRQTVQLQLNKGEYRHKLPRRIFFADQGEFTTGDYEEIMNKASCLSLVSNAILYWNTIKINDIVENLRAQGEEIDKETLSHISLLPFRHVVPNGTYFIEDV